MLSSTQNPFSLVCYYLMQQTLGVFSDQGSSYFIETNLSN
jgi:hypothetical protein